MNILVVVASRHGSTHEIAEVLAQHLRDAQHTVEVQDAADAGDAAPYDAVIVGSGIYMGSWLAEARRFVALNQNRLATVPVWLFSSGPLGRDDPQPRQDPAHLDDLLQATGARGHQMFVGKLDKSSLGLGERLVTKVVRAPEGDFRDWEAVRVGAADRHGTTRHAGEAGCERLVTCHTQSRCQKWQRLRGDTRCAGLRHE
jgi:menaquinone-dependent protoporphyrinogen oxidase